MAIKNKRRLIIALVCYFILIVVMLVLFLPIRNRSDGGILAVVLIFLTYLAMRTIDHADDDKDDE
jgi:heme/copper-type cytochrome/quinol oxidase subunit 4